MFNTWKNFLSGAGAAIASEGNLLTGGGANPSTHKFADERRKSLHEAIGIGETPNAPESRGYISAVQKVNADLDRRGIKLDAASQRRLVGTIRGIQTNSIGVPEAHRNEFRAFTNSAIRSLWAGEYRNAGAAAVGAGTNLFAASVAEQMQRNDLTIE